jgi:rhodanese-related sulfurtransferase
VNSISPRQLHDVKSAGKPIDLIDVRTPMEFREIHVEGACNVPLDTLDPALAVRSRRAAADDPLYVICRSGGRGKQACSKFITAGFPNVVNIEGGTLAWAEAGLPVVRGQKGISLERQVRIAAGLLVVLGTVLGYFTHPAFLILSGFVGAGLMYAGATDRCGMALVLAKMPWNRGVPVGTSCTAPPAAT